MVNPRGLGHMSGQKKDGGSDGRKKHRRWIAYAACWEHVGDFLVPETKESVFVPAYLDCYATYVERILSTRSTGHRLVLAAKFTLWMAQLTHRSCLIALGLSQEPTK